VIFGTLLERAIVAPQLANFRRRLLDAMPAVENSDVAIRPRGHPRFLQVMLGRSLGRIRGGSASQIRLRGQRLHLGRIT